MPTPKSYRHGHRGLIAPSGTYQSWRGIKQRCLNPMSHAFDRYGGRGITMCERWKDFANFLEDMGERPRFTTIDRTDNSKGYYPENCRWSTAKEQRRNSRPAPLTLKPSAKNTSGFVGVSFDKWGGVWRASIRRNKITTRIGSFKDRLDAAQAYMLFHYIAESQADILSGSE